MPLRLENNSLASQPNELPSQNDQHRSQPEPVSRTSTPLHRPKELRTKRDNELSTFNGFSKPLGAKEVSEKHSRALAMKMNVPDTTAIKSSGYQLDVKKPGVTAHKTSVAYLTSKKSETQLTYLQARPRDQHQSTFDDTESFDFGDETFLQDNENRTMVFRGERPQSPQTYVLDGRHKQEPQSAHEEDIRLPGLGGRLPSNWKEIADEERIFQRYAVASEHAGYSRQKFEKDAVRSWAQAEELQPTFTDTPSRVQPTLYTQVAHPDRTIKTVSFYSPTSNSREVSREESPELVAPQKIRHDVSRANGAKPGLNEDKTCDNVSQAPIRPDTSNPFFRSPVGQRLPDQTLLNQHSVSTFESSRASDCPTSSEDGNSSVQPGSPVKETQRQGIGDSSKRPLDDKETDYDMTALKMMKYEDLRLQKFEIDPGAVSQDVAFDSQGNTKTLSQRLDNLGRMTEDEQKNRFRNQGDEEWAQTGSWFIEKFQDDLKRLMDVRLERRKISMRYEDEIRRRQKTIEWCSAKVDEDLRGLKKGGGDLIKGRDVSSRRSTPLQKRDVPHH